MDNNIDISQQEKWARTTADREAKWQKMKEELAAEGIYRTEIWEGSAPDTEIPEGFRAGLYILPVHTEAPRGMLIVCAGGAFLFKSSNEAKPVAEYFHKRGFNAAILDYTVDRNGIPASVQSTPARIAAGKDASRAIRYLRAKSGELGIRPDKIGICGFSAGGRATQLAMTMFDYGDPGADDCIGKASSRPDAAMLLYGASTYSIEIKGSGKYDIFEQQRIAATDTICIIPPDCPPVFLFQTNRDDPRKVLYYALELAMRGIPHEVHTFQDGPHGAGLYNGCDVDTPYFRHTQKWADLAASWLIEQGF